MCIRDSGPIVLQLDTFYRQLLAPNDLMHLSYGSFVVDNLSTENLISGPQFVQFGSYVAHVVWGKSDCLLVLGIIGNEAAAGLLV